MGKGYSDKEIEYITDQYGKKTYKEIATALCRSAESVKCKAYELGIVKPTSVPKKVYAVYDSSDFIVCVGTMLEICDCLGKTRSTVASAIHRQKEGKQIDSKYKFYEIKGVQ